MGIFQSKDPKQYDHIAQRLQECVEDHDNNLKSIEETVKAQKSALDLLTKYEGRKQTDGAQYRQRTDDVEYGRQQTDGAGCQPHTDSAGRQPHTDGTGSQPHTDSTGLQPHTDGTGWNMFPGRTEERQHSDDAKGDEQHTEDEIYRDRQILANIQGVLLLQCDITKTNFKHLKHCVLDSIKDVVEDKNLTTKWSKLLDNLSYTQPECNEPRQKYESQRDATWFDGQLEILKQTMDLQYRNVLEYQSDIKHRNFAQKDQNKLAAKDQEIQSLRADVARHKTTIAKHETALQDALSKSRRLDNENYRLENQISQLEETKRRLEEQIRKKVKQKVPIQLYYLRNDELMTTVVQELNAMLVTHMSSLDFELEIQHRKQSNDIKPDIPVLALCINASRLGTDAASAITGLRSSNQIALLIFHHKDVHAIPSQRSERMLTGQEFKDLGVIVDLVFLRGKGIYTCDLNNDALRSITRFIKK